MVKQKLTWSVLETVAPYRSMAEQGHKWQMNRGQILDAPGYLSVEFIFYSE